MVEEEEENKKDIVLLSASKKIPTFVSSLISSISSAHLSAIQGSLGFHLLCSSTLHNIEEHFSFDSWVGMMIPFDVADIACH